MTEVEGLLLIREFTESLNEQIRTMIHKRFIMHQRTHGIEIRKALSRLS